MKWSRQAFSWDIQYFNGGLRAHPGAFQTTQAFLSARGLRNMITLAVQDGCHDQQMPGTYGDAQLTAFASLPVNRYTQGGFHHEPGF
jgi:hypothetical protein